MHARTEGLLLVGHGSRSEAGQGELLALADLVAAAASAVTVRAGFLELSDPPAVSALDRLVDAGATDITVVPLMLNPAGHAKNDVPAIVLDGRARHPGVVLHYARPLGIDHVTVDLARERVVDAGAGGLPLLVVARGTSEPEANADAVRAARLIAECTQAPLVLTGFSGLTWPSVPDVLEQASRLGVERLAVFAWYLCTGVLVDRMLQRAHEWSAKTGIEIVDAGHLGPDPKLVPLVLARADEARNGGARMTCDVCSYRAPFPGLEARVGQALGVGHSHLAAEHAEHAHAHAHHG